MCWQPPTYVSSSMIDLKGVSRALAVTGLLALLLLPVPTFVVDLALGANLALAILLILAALSAGSPRAVSALPSILIATTCVRLALNVSTTRLILVQANAGQVVAAFGSVVVADTFNDRVLRCRDGAAWI